MSFYQFAAQNPILVFALFLCTGFSIEWVIKSVLHHANVSKHGWPPAHYDKNEDL